MLFHGDLRSERTRGFCRRRAAAPAAGSAQRRQKLQNFIGNPSENRQNLEGTPKKKPEKGEFHVVKETRVDIP